jgi:hypothetical protein
LEYKHYLLFLRKLMKMKFISTLLKILLLQVGRV